MLFASGGILHQVFQDIALQATLEKYWLPPVGAVLGFLFGVLGQLAAG
jgi:ZIP family zinc transporter